MVILFGVSGDFTFWDFVVDLDAILQGLECGTTIAKLGSIPVVHEAIQG